MNQPRPTPPAAPRPPTPRPPAPALAPPPMSNLDKVRLFLDRCYVALHSILPTHFLSWLMFHITRARAAGFKNAFIGIFVKLYSVDLSEAEFEIVKSYPDFNTFFTRALKPGARPIDPAPTALISPFGLSGTRRQNTLSSRPV